MRVEFLITPQTARNGGAALRALLRAAERDGCEVRVGPVYRGRSELLVLYGIGSKTCREARDKHLKTGGRTILWDLGYLRKGKRDKSTDYLRFSLDRDHPAHLLDRAPDNDGARWRALGVPLREDADPEGPIILVGLGKKTQRYLKLGVQWEQEKYEELLLRFPQRKILFRPKRGAPTPTLDCPVDSSSPIEKVLRGASLVVCRHSNVAVDAIIAGVPFECDDGAARWLQGREFSRENRTEFLQRLAWFQWLLLGEAPAAWSFLKKALRE